MGKVLNSTEQAWSDALLLRLRMRDVPGARIGEVLAEVQSHLTETGEHPQQAFGPPKEYADRIADALGAAPSRGWRDALRGLSWRDLVAAAVIGLACYLLTDGLWALGAGTMSILGLSGWLTSLLAALVLGGCIARLVRQARLDPDGDKVIDPRTGADLAPFQGWQVGVLVAVPILALVAAVVGGVLAR